MYQITSLYNYFREGDMIPPIFTVKSNKLHLLLCESLF